MGKFFVDWFSQQEEFTTDIEEMNNEELNKCLRKFYMSGGKEDGGYYNKATLTSIRAAVLLIGTCATSHTTSHFR